MPLSFLPTDPSSKLIGGRTLALVGAMIGDSRPAYLKDGLGLSAGSPGDWISRLSGQRIQFHPYLMGAVGSERCDMTFQRLAVGGAGGVGPDPENPGQSKTYAALTGTGVTSGLTGQTGPLLPYFIANGVTHIWMILPINDHNSTGDYALSKMKAYLQATIDLANSAGITVVLNTSHAHDSAYTPAWTTVQLARYNNLRDWAISKSGVPGLIVVDISPIFTDPATGLATVASLKDMTHWTVPSAYQVGKRNVAALLPYAPLFSPLSIDSSVYNATDNPRGNLLTKGVLAGTAGTVNNAGGATVNNSAGIADGWYLTASNATGLTITFSKIALDPILGSDVQQIQISGTSGASAPVVDLIHSAGINYPSPVPLGSKLELYGGFSVDAGTLGVGALGFGLTTGSTLYYEGAAPSANPTLYPSEAFSGVDHIPDFLVPATGSSFVVARHRVALAANATISATYRLKGATVKLVP